MSETPLPPPSILRAILSNWVTIGILLLSLAFVAEALTLRGDAGRFPIAVGLCTAILAAIELIQSCRSPGLQAEPTKPGPLQDKLLIGSWFVATLALFYVLGILIGIAISGTVYFYLFARKRLHWAVIAGLAHTAFFWIAFDLLAGFRLYGGILQ